MQTLKAKNKFISHPNILKDASFQSTGLFYKLYNNAELLEDKGFKKELLAKNSLIDVSMLDSIISDVKTKLAQKETYDKKKIAEIEQIEIILSNENKKIITKKKRYKLTNKVSQLKRNLGRDSCFGGKALLRKITKHAQLAKKINNKLTEKEVAENQRLYEKELLEFRSKRSIGVYVLGRAIEGGNRKFDFDLINNRIIFKPNKDTKIEIIFSDKRTSILSKLQYLIDANSIPITVRLTEKEVFLSYDEAILNGFNFDKNEFNRTIKKHKISTSEGRKEVSKDFFKDLEKRKLVGKIGTRFGAVDINPYEIGFAIGEKINDKGEFKTIVKCVYDLSKLSENNGLSSTDNTSNVNKRKHEIKEVWKAIFTAMIHYKVYNFVSEDLNFKPNHKKETTAEFNRLTKNIWHRTLTNQLIKKYINIYGFNHIEVNPCYSSFVGNMVHEEYDPVASAKELLRRGIVKYIKGSSLYPEIAKINRQKLTYLVGENIEFQSFPSLYKHITCAGLRYRNRELISLADTNLKSYKSKVKIFCL
jgi:hypothetical protein